jgi:hypothetical protein
MVNGKQATNFTSSVAGQNIKMLNIAFFFLQMAGLTILD